MRGGSLARLLALGALLAAWLALSANGPIRPPFSSPPKPTTPHPAGKPAPIPRVPPTRPRAPIDLAREAASYEDLGAYAQAVDELRRLRGQIAPDADLDLALAIDEARIGRLDSAAVLLGSPAVEAAVDDSLPLGRRHRYPWTRAELWVNGTFDGWNWYVARVRAEVAASLGRWDEALVAARRCVEARPLSGKEWLIRALAAGRDDHPGEAADAAARAVWLDPSLPEAHYLHGLYEWRAGRRATAQEQFRAAVSLDSSYRAPALALMRSALPGVRPDTLPAVYLTGARQAELLTSPARPKEEEHVQMDSPASLIRQVDAPVPDSLKGTFQEAHLAIAILIDERGRVIDHDLPWFSPPALPEAMLSATLARLPQWRFKPAVKLGVPQRVWSMVMVKIRPD